ncbi:MAG: protease inhibitor I42 family protein [Proteobacteria bacterium]|nr:protease inhibitor I42 family protein [Pseudomonadota bacterium]
MAEILIGEGHNGGTITGRPGDILVIRLAENPTTGFRWSATQADPEMLRPQSDDFEPAAGTGLGGGGLRTFRYLLTGGGDTALALQLARPWEATAPRSEFRIRVSIGR